MEEGKRNDRMGGEGIKRRIRGWKKDGRRKEEMKGWGEGELREEEDGRRKEEMKGWGRRR